MQNRSKKMNNSLIAGVLIGSVAGLAFGALVTNLVYRLFGKVWLKVTQRDQLHEVDPRWLLQ